MDSTTRVGVLGGGGWGLRGAEVPVSRHQIFLEMVYSSQLLDQSKPDQQNHLYDDIYFVDDSFRLRSMVFRVGGAFSFYNPKELK